MRLWLNLEGLAEHVVARPSLRGSTHREVRVAL
jgi:hypothetical protein